MSLHLMICEIIVLLIGAGPVFQDSVVIDLGYSWKFLGLSRLQRIDLKGYI
jgi:hypothetical protein